MAVWMYYNSNTQANYSLCTLYHLIDCLLHSGMMTRQICAALCWGQLERDRRCRNCSGVLTVAGIATSRQRWAIDQWNKLVLCRSELPILCSASAPQRQRLQPLRHTAGSKIWSKFCWICLRFYIICTYYEVKCLYFIVNKVYINLHKLTNGCN